MLVYLQVIIFRINLVLLCNLVGVAYGQVLDMKAILTMSYISEYACWKINVMFHLHFWCTHVQIYLSFQVVGVVHPVSEQANWT